MKRISLILLIIIAVIMAFISCNNPEPPAEQPEDPVAEQPAEQAEDHSDLITVDTPVPNQLVTSPLTIEGQASGTWFFEATFPVKLLDGNGNVIAEYYAQTEEEWMTEDFIDFTSVLEFDDPGTDTGTLLLIRDNPSDIREYDAQVEIPVRFK